MAKPRPATWLEKEMIYDAVKNSSEELPVDLSNATFREAERETWYADSMASRYFI